MDLHPIPALEEEVESARGGYTHDRESVSDFFLINITSDHEYDEPNAEPVQF